MTGGVAETVTIVFTDLVDSTRIRSELGEEVADRLASTHDEILRRAVDEHLGAVVKSLGDGVLAVFDSAADAIDAAVEMQRRTDLYTRSADALAPMLVGAASDWFPFNV